MSVVDGWYAASGARATFAFRVEGGRVTAAAPYARSWLLGKTWAEAWEKLHASRYDVAALEMPAAPPAPARTPDHQMAGLLSARARDEGER